MGNGRLDPARLEHYVARAVVRASGDFAEVGVWEGDNFSRLISLARDCGRTAWAFDSFVGMAEPGPNDGDQYPKGRFSVGGVSRFVGKMQEMHGRVRKKGDGWEVCAGFVPWCLAQVGDRRFAFVYIDLDHYEPTKLALEWAWEHVQDGGIILCDDYVAENVEKGILAARAIAAFVHDTRDGGRKVWEKLDNDQLAIYR